jgi:hypothetical protein
LIVYKRLTVNPLDFAATNQAFQLPVHEFGHQLVFAEVGICASQQDFQEMKHNK